MPIVSATQASFEKGQIDSEFYGHQSDSVFQKAAKELKNVDILTSGILQKRTGLRDSYKQPKSVAIQTDTVEHNDLVAGLQAKIVETQQVPIPDNSKLGFSIIEVSPKAGTAQTFLAGAESFKLYFLRPFSFQEETPSFRLDFESDLLPRLGGGLFRTTRKITFRGMEKFITRDGITLFLKEEGSSGVLSAIWPIWFPFQGIFGGRFEVFGRLYEDNLPFEMNLHKVNFVPGEYRNPIQFRDRNVYDVTSTRAVTDNSGGATTARFLIKVREAGSLGVEKESDLTRVIPDNLLMPNHYPDRTPTLAEITTGADKETDPLVVKKFFKGDTTYLPRDLFKYGRLIRPTSRDFDAVQRLYKLAQQQEGAGGLILWRVLRPQTFGQTISEWAGGVNYNEGRIVSFKANGRFYRSRRSNINDRPDTSPDSWELLGDDSNKDVLVNVVRMDSTSFLFIPAWHPTGNGVHATWLKYALVGAEAGYFSWLSALATQNLYSIPRFNFVEGYPHSVAEENNRLYYANKNTVQASSQFSPEGINMYLPRQGRLSDELVARIQKLKDSGASVDSLRLLVGSDSTADEIYFRNIELDGRQAPYRLQVTGDSLEQSTDRAFVSWVQVIRGLVVGTKKEEVVSKPQQSPEFTGQLSLQEEHSFRGSGSSLTAVGDYSLFFVGPLRKSIFQLFYDDGVSGLRSQDATYLHSFKSEVRDMVWDQLRRALFVLLDDGTLKAFYFQREYKVEGWTTWTFDTDREIRKLLVVEGRLGLITEDDTNFNISFFQPFDSDDDDDYGDKFGDEEKLIGTVGDFFKVPPGGEVGSFAPYLKKVQYVTVLTQNVTELWFQGERFLYNRSDVPILTKDLSVYVKNQNTILPTLKVTHTKKEKARFLSTSGKYSIMDGMRGG